MEIDAIYSCPDLNVLNEIVSGPQIEVASPFYSAASLKLVAKGGVKRMALITRLPTQYIMPSAFIENDPRPLSELFSTMNDQLKLYALPSLHAKLYLRDKFAWVGSANMTLNGFSGKPEIVIRFKDREKYWAGVFSDYRNLANPVKKADLEKLQRWIDLGLTKVRSQENTAERPTGETSHAPLTFEDFVEWLAEPSQPHPSIRKHILDRVKGKNFMSGHVPPAFHGAMAFLRLKSEHRSRLVKTDDTSIPSDIISDFASFVEKHGDEYRGSQGGYWRNYLSTRLGGAQQSGGAGDTVAKKCLVLIPAYVNARRQPQFG